MVGAVDVLFVDEAGQFSLANALAVAPAAPKLVLLGDPQQLDQPRKGTHPPGVAASVLEQAAHGGQLRFVLCVRTHARSGQEPNKRAIRDSPKELTLK